MTMTKCKHCACVPDKGHCCDKAELQALRRVVDQAITVISSEVRSPLVIDDGGAAREVLKSAKHLLQRARSAA